MAISTDSLEMWEISNCRFWLSLQSYIGRDHASWWNVPMDNSTKIGKAYSGSVNLFYNIDKHIGCRSSETVYFLQNLIIRGSHQYKLEPFGNIYNNDLRNSMELKNEDPLLAHYVQKTKEHVTNWLIDCKPYLFLWRPWAPAFFFLRSSNFWSGDTLQWICLQRIIEEKRTW